MVGCRTLAFIGRRRNNMYRNRETAMARKPYESDTTQFIREFLQKHPEVVEKQRDARATWWDRPQDREQRKKFEDARLPMKPYVYY